MVRLFFLMRRLSHLTLDEFQAHWLNIHTQTNEPFKLMRRYVQYHTVPDDPTRNLLPQARLSSVPPYDGIASAWYDSRKHMEDEHDVLGSEDVAIAVEDHKYFIDDDRSEGCVTEEHSLVEPDQPVPFVLVGSLRRRADRTRDAFERALLGLADIAKVARQRRAIAGFIISNTLSGDAGKLAGIGADVEPWDGITTCYFASLATFKAFAVSDLAQRWAEAEAEMVDPEHSAYTLTTRHVIKQIVR